MAGKPRPYFPEDLDRLWEQACRANKVQQPPELPPPRVRLLWPRSKKAKTRKRFVQPSQQPAGISAALADLWAHHKGRDTLAGTTKGAQLRSLPPALPCAA